MRRRWRRVSSPGAFPPSARAAVNRISTTMSSARPAPKPRSIMVGVGVILMKVQIRIGSPLCGWWKGFAFMKLVKPAVNSSGAVSPTMRAMPSTDTVVKPDLAVGKTTFHTVRH
jgi:hypothetical protein